jgi:hypothetical protein
MGLQSNGLSLEVVGREVSGRPVPGKPRRPSGPYLLGLPALLLSCLLLIPIGVTVVAAFRTPSGFGFGNFAVMGDPGALRAMGNSLIWVAVAFGLVVVGFFLALLSYRLPGLTSFLQPALVMPFAVSVLVSGATFRLIFDPAPERGTLTAVWTSLFGSSPVWLGPGLFWLVLVSAFGWTWLGYVVSLFRAGLDAIPDDVSRTIAAEGVTGWRRPATPADHRCGDPDARHRGSPGLRLGADRRTRADAALCRRTRSELVACDHNRRRSGSYGGARCGALRDRGRCRSGRRTWAASAPVGNAGGSSAT